MIALTIEPNEGFDFGIEHCCFCASRTPYWHAPKDVPVCQGCAEAHSATDVPNKEQWWVSPQAAGQRQD